MPPLDVIVDALLHVVLPAAIVAFALSAGGRFVQFAPALGLAAAYGLVAWHRDLWTLMPGESSWNRLHYAVLAALVIEQLVQALPGRLALIRCFLRIAVSVGISFLVIPSATRAEVWWLMPLLAALVFAVWSTLTYLAARPPDGSVPLALALAAFVAAGVLVHAGSARLTEAATALSAALGGIAVACILLKIDGSSAVPGAAVLLPGLLLIGQQETFSDLTWHAFALPAVAPLAMVFLLPFPKLQGFPLMCWRLSLVLVPLVIAMALAMQTGPLEFE
ncbi:MAG: hypothetical protein L0Y72_07105 [Gemmataceae bacterium]|nr:hypothetical protein [Gemmataceae bacterium]MCI0738794.1 hypothetical protein [Gemmataceae bacterium]